LNIACCKDKLQKTLVQFEKELKAALEERDAALKAKAQQDKDDKASAEALKAAREEVANLKAACEKESQQGWKLLKAMDFLESEKAKLVDQIKELQDRLEESRRKQSSGPGDPKKDLQAWQELSIS